MQARGVHAHRGLAHSSLASRARSHASRAAVSSSLSRPVCTTGASVAPPAAASWGGTPGACAGKQLRHSPSRRTACRRARRALASGPRPGRHGSSRRRVPPTRSFPVAPAPPINAGNPARMRCRRTARRYLPKPVVDATSCAPPLPIAGKAMCESLPHQSPRSTPRVGIDRSAPSLRRARMETALVVSVYGRQRPPRRRRRPARRQAPGCAAWVAGWPGTTCRSPCWTGADRTAPGRRGRAGRGSGGRRPA